MTFISQAGRHFVPVVSASPVESAHPFEGPGALRRCFPFGAVFLVAVALAFLPPNSDMVWQLIAGVLCVAVAVGVAVTPWRRVPNWCQMLPPMSCYLIIGLLRHAEGGATAAIGPMATLPVFWLALYGTRLQLWVAIAGGTLVYAVPLLLIGGVSYPAVGWQRAALWTLVAILIGPAVQRLVHKASSRGDELQHLIEMTDALASDHQARAKACDAVRKLSTAEVCVIMEPALDGDLVITASAGADLVGRRVSPGHEIAGSIVAFTTKERLFVPDIQNSALVSQRFKDDSTVCSAVYEPLLQSDGDVIRCTGVLCLGFTRQVHEIDNDLSLSLGLIGRELSLALGRKQSLERLDLLARSTFDVVSLHHMNGDTTYVSPSVSRQFGYDPSVFIGQRWDEFVHPEDIALLRSFNARLLDTTGEEPVEPLVYRLRHADGSWIWIESVGDFLRDPFTNEPAQIHFTSRRIDERKEAETALQSARDRMAGVLAAATEFSIIGTDLHGTVNVFNVGAERMLGYSASDAIGKFTPEYFHLESELAERTAELGLVGRFQSLIQGALQGAAETREWTYVSSDGMHIPVLLTVSATHDSNGTIDGFIGIATNISDRRRATKELESAYLREHAMVIELRSVAESKRSFIASVTHDLKTPLASIKGYAEMLAEESTGLLNTSQARMLEVIERNSGRLLGLIDDLLTVARMESGGLFRESIDVDLKDVVSNVCTAHLPASRLQRIRLETHFSDDALNTLGDTAQLERVFANLVSNAIKFTPENGLVSIEGRRSGSQVMITITDTGMGIPDAEQSTIFDEFTRASNVKERHIAGTGLGLGIAKQIVTEHHGTLEMRSKVDVGTTIIVTLPAA